MITTLDQAAFRALLVSISKGNCALVAVKHRTTGSPGVAIVIHDDKIEEATGARWVPIAVLSPEACKLLIPESAKGWPEFSNQIPLHSDEPSEMEFAPNMPRAPLFN